MSFYFGQIHKVVKPEDVFFLQIGAMDGKSFDPLSASVERFQWKGLCVEPLSDQFQKLQKRHHARSITCVQTAIVDDPSLETVELYRVDPAALDTIGSIPDWAVGISSLYTDRNPIGGIRCKKHEFESFKHHIIKERVPACTLSTLLEQYNIEKIDILVVDTEGYDYHVLKQIDFDHYKPFIIYAEICHLPSVEAASLCNLLQQHGYKYKRVGNDMVATCKPL